MDAVPGICRCYEGGVARLFVRQVQYSLNDMLVDFKTQKCGKEGYNKARTAKHTFAPRPSKQDHPDACRKKRS